MKAWKYCLLAMAVGSALSCVASLLPLFDDGYVIFEPDLLGAWKIAGEPDTWTFEKAGENEYLLIQRQAEYDLSSAGQPSKKVPGDTARFDARLGRIGGKLFLDFMPSDGNPMPRNDWLNAHLIPAHTLAQVTLTQDSLKLNFLDEDWVGKAVEDGRVKLPYVKTDGWLVLTAPTADMQAFILKFAGDPHAFPESGADKLIRVK